MKPIREWWGVEWDGWNGSVSFHPVMDILERNGKTAKMWGKDQRLILGLFPSMEAAQEGVREAKRKLKERTEEKNHETETAE